MERVYERPANMLTAAEAAALKRVSIRQFRRWVAAKKITATCELYCHETGWEAVHLYRRVDVNMLYRRSQWRYK